MKPGDKVVFNPPKDLSLEQMIDQLMDLNQGKTRDECREVIYQMWSYTKPHYPSIREI